MAAVVAVRDTRKEAVVGRPKRRSARAGKRSGLCMVCGLAAATAMLLGYVGMYAQVTHTGYHRAALLSELRNERLENESLRVEIQNLISPDRLTAAARAAGMLPGTDINYVSLPRTISVASADGER